MALSDNQSGQRSRGTTDSADSLRSSLLLGKFVSVEIEASGSTTSPRDPLTYRTGAGRRRLL